MMIRPTSSVKRARSDFLSQATSVNSGSAILVVLTVLTLMTVLLIANARVVWNLNRELRLVEKRQLIRWSAREQGAPVQKAVPQRPAANR